MQRMKSSISAGMTRSFQIAITTSLILIVTISLVTNQVLAVEVVNTNLQNNSTSTTTSTIQLQNPTFKTRIQDRIDKLLQYKNSKTDEKLTSLKTFLQSAIDERKTYILENFNQRLDGMDKISESDRTDLKNTVNDILSKLDTQSIFVNTASNIADLKNVKDQIYTNSKTFLVEGPKLHFKIEIAKLNFYKSKAEIVSSALKSKIDELNTKGKDVSALNDFKTKLDNQIAALDSNIKTATELDDKITAQMNADELKIAKENVRSSIETAYNTVKIIKQNLNDISAFLKK